MKPSPTAICKNCGNQNGCIMWVIMKAVGAEKCKLYCQDWVKKKK